MERLRVLQAIRQGKTGGGERHLLDLVAHLDKSCFEPVVLSFTDGPMITTLQQQGVAHQVIATEKPFDVQVWPRVKQMLREHRIDLVHVHGTRANTNVLWAARSLGLPVIYTVHGWSFHDGLPWWQRMARIAAEKFITRCTRCNITVSEANYHSGAAALGGLKAVVVRNGVDLQRFNPVLPQPDLRAAYGIRPEELVIGFIGRMTAQKAPHLLVQAMAALLKENIPIRLLMIGDGDAKAGVMQQAATLGITGQIIFDGFRQDVPALLQAIDIYCLPSYWEGYPIGVLEAMAMGCSVIATAVDGTREAVAHMENGMLIPPGDVDALVAAIRLLRDNPALRLQLQQAARNRAVAEFDVVHMTRQIEKVYRQCIQE